MNSFNFPLELALIPLAIGAIFGYFLARLLNRRQVDNERKDIEERIHAKEKEIAGDLYESLYDLHNGLIQTVKSYDSAVQTVLEKLPTPEERLEKIGTDRLKTLEFVEEQANTTVETVIEEDSASWNIDSCETDQEQESLDRLGDQIELTEENHDEAETPRSTTTTA